MPQEVAPKPSPSTRENVLSLPWPSSRESFFFAECEDYASRIDALFERTDLVRTHCAGLVESACTVLRTDQDLFARSRPVMFIMGVENGLPDVPYLEDFIDACERVECLESIYGDTR